MERNPGRSALPTGLPIRIWPPGPRCTLRGEAGFEHLERTEAATLSLDDFQELARRALEDLPDEISRHLDNVMLFIEEDGTDPESGDPLLGLYEGTPLTERDEGWAVGSLPDRITLYRGPILDLCASRAEILYEIQVTVIHEIAHHFGVDDARLHELGWG
ncbi:metallopeptidase family protein [Arthrobacter sp. NPDC090010]|uniref:metallopeptidase family protein n=1 Tax=Arthrobacter sp. NPDC090010 TaxID=3363942 RepID=UPI0038150567